MLGPINQDNERFSKIENSIFNLEHYFYINLSYLYLIEIIFNKQIERLFKKNTKLSYLNY